MPEQMRPESAGYVSHCCHQCQEVDRTRVVPIMSRMIVCPDCGNKRCPKATNHRLDCTDSNDPGQPGSWFQ